MWCCTKKRLFPFRAFSYRAYLGCAPSPKALNFITRLLQQLLVSFRTFSTALMFILRIVLQRLLSLFECNHKLCESSSFSFHLEAQNTSQTTPAPSSMGAWQHLPPAPALIPHPHPSPSITVGHPTSLWCGGMVAPPPDPNPLSVSLEVLGWEMRTVCVGGGDRGQPSPIGNLYRNTEEMGIKHACLISPNALSFFPHILLRRLSSFSAFSYSAQFQYAPSPMMLTSSFIKHLLLPHLSSFRAFSYGA